MDVLDREVREGALFVSHDDVDDMWVESLSSDISAGCCWGSASCFGSVGTFACPASTAGSASSGATASTGC